MNGHKFKIIKQSGTFIENNINYDIIIGSKDGINLSDLDNEYFESFFLINNQERDYLNKCLTILKSGSRKKDRTNTGTISLIGEHLRFRLDSFPLLTTKKVSFNNIFWELLFFLLG